jgi:PTH1 family peptidyl-tRNA hydrolase
LTWLVVGLGNPGEEYRATRHNIGFMVVDEWVQRSGGASWRSKSGGQIAHIGENVALKPQEFMNLSGEATQRIAHFHKIGIANLLVIHDEIDLPFGTLRIKVGGGHGGHNGLRSVTQHLGEGYVRVRCGVGKPEGGKERVIGHVLGAFNKIEQKELPTLLGAAADAVELILKKGPLLAMNQVNAETKPRS